MSHRLKNLFNFYAADLARFVPQYIGHFACPLCCKVKVIDPTVDICEIVAEEHIVPEKLGGRLTTLTCRKCNNDQGSALDAHLIQRVKAERQRHPLKARVRIGNGELGAEIFLPRTPADSFEIRGVRKQSNQKRVQEAMRALEGGEKKISLRVNFGYNPPRSEVGLLRAAYLLMFRYFGYRYALDASARPVQWQIQHPLEKTAVLNGIMWNIPDSIPRRSVVSFVRAPKDFQGFFVILQLDRATNHCAGVMLPPPGQEGMEFYALLQIPSAVGCRQLTAVKPPPSKEFWPMMELWNHYTRVT